MPDTPHIKRFDEHLSKRSATSLRVAGPFIRAAGDMLNDLAEHIERLEERVSRAVGGHEGVTSVVVTEADIAAFGTDTAPSSEGGPTHGPQAEPDHRVEARTRLAHDRVT